MSVRILPPELASQIAAGEVVERPVSVVKELLENSLDANASRISVEIKGGGVESIRIVDNGYGIPSNEVVLAFQRHATSKVESRNSLDAIATLGFRGEALPSIAAVSRMSMVTRFRDCESGFGADFLWGGLVKEGAQGCPPGTVVQVSDLFGNLPARRRFLKSATAETGRIHDLLARYALAYPEVAFQLRVGDRQSLSTPGNGISADAVLAVYGSEVSSNLLEITGEGPESAYSVDGFIGNPGLNRANRTYMTFFVNRRWIQSRMLTFALEEAYHGLLPERRYPLAIVNISVPFEDVDVNSHPAKREVRFHQDGRVYSALQRAVRESLVASSPVRAMRAPGARSYQEPPQSDTSPRFFTSPFDSRSLVSGAAPAFGSESREGAPIQGSGPADAALTPRQALPSLRVVGQVRLTYIVAESPDGMYLVDQHAAHERVLFDRIIRKGVNSGSQSQSLLAPVSVDLSPSQIATLTSNRDFLVEYGFKLEEFGGNSYLVRAVPSFLTRGNPAKSLVDILDMVAFEGAIDDQEQAVAASLACHAAIRAGQSMTETEMRALLEQLEVTDSPHTCPHGRPTVIHFSSYHMEREFGRR
ncbi:MAG: DNA mismatch repair endonuclease MutL [Chloroflexi bacterium]|nr:DNA mismatch repair endonuclease MutL [Chloroflexota bacterium]